MNLKIKTKFIYLALSVFFTLALLAWLSISIANKGFQYVTDVYKDSQEVQTLEAEFIEPLYNLRELTLTLSIAPNNDFRKSINDELSLELKKLDSKFEKFDTSINIIWKQYKKLLEITRRYINKNFDEGAFINVTTVERKQFKVLISSLKELQSSRLQQSKNTFDTSKETLSEDKLHIILGILFIFLFSLFIGYLISKNIISAISKVGKGLEEFFIYLHNPKNYNKDIIIDVSNKDELGQMATSINAEIGFVKKELEKNYLLIDQVIFILQEIKNNKSNNRLTANTDSKEFNLLKDLINEMIDNLEYKVQTQIDERMNQEKLLIQQSKLAEMGNMIGNIAHQWRQPLSEINAIILELQLSARFKSVDENYVVEQIDECFKITEYMSRTISDFQNFFRPSKEKESFSVLEACTRATSIISSSLKFYNIKLVFDSKDDMEILGYPNEFAQALLNLLSNAKDILIEREIKNPEITLKIKRGKKYTLISVEDNAKGIKEENINKVFDPYYTTKHAKQGTGIGLYMTKTIIENNMNGFVNVRNSESGALFTIKIK